MSELTRWFLSNGVSIELLQIFVFIPILVTIVNLSRYFIGFKSFGIYVPIILAVAYHYTGLRYGLLITILVALSTLIGYTIMRRIRMHYLARVAINYVIMSVVVLFGISFINSIEILGFSNFSNVNPLALISIATLSDFFIKMYVKKNLGWTIRVLFETILISVIGWFVIASDTLTVFLINNLWVLGLVLVLNLVIGRYEGLRIKEYFRFSYIIKNDNK